MEHVQDREDCKDLITSVGKSGRVPQLTKKRVSHSVKKLVRRFDSIMVSCKHMHSEAQEQLWSEVEKRRESEGLLI